MATREPTRMVGDAPDLLEFIGDPALPPEARGMVPLADQTFPHWSAHAFATLEGFADHCAGIDQGAAWNARPFGVASAGLTYKVTPLGYGKAQKIDAATWRGGLTFADALQAAREGWSEGADKAAALRDKIHAANPTGPRLVKWDVAGAVPSVARYLAGNPLNMRRIDTSALRRRPVLTLVSNIGGMSAVHPRVFLNRAAAVAAVVDVVEAAGFACNLIAASTAVAATATGRVINVRDLAATVAISLKDSHSPADIARLAYGLGHPAMLRRLVFACRSESDYTRALSDNMGMTVPQEQSEAMALAGVYVLPGANETMAEFDSEESTVANGLNVMVEALAKQGCPAFPDERAAA